jgi:hypothetical protein
MPNSAMSVATGSRVGAATAVAAPALAIAADTAVDPASELLPAVMHYQVDYDASGDTPDQLHAAVHATFRDAGETHMRSSRPGCATISGSGAGWDDSDSVC